MDLKDYLTNEKIRKKFGNQFDLVNYAIKLAENMILTGRDPRVKTDSQNRSLQVLTEILNGKDHLDDLTLEFPDDEEEVGNLNGSQKEEPEAPPAKSTERKKPRKVAAK